jgi:hypothetical protein
MHRFTIAVCLAVFTLVFSLSLADIPKLINYQGMLTDDGGNPLNETVNITFKIYNDSLSVSESNKKWEEVQSGIQVVNGLFNVMLGRVTDLDLDFSEDYWLDVTVGGEHLPDRVRLTSVGYAYRAQVADSATVATSTQTGGGWVDDGMRSASGRRIRSRGCISRGMGASLCGSTTVGIRVGLLNQEALITPWRSGRRIRKEVFLLQISYLRAIPGLSRSAATSASER